MKTHTLAYADPTADEALAHLDAMLITADGRLVFPDSEPMSVDADTLRWVLSARHVDGRRVFPVGAIDDDAPMTSDDIGERLSVALSGWLALDWLTSAMIAKELRLKVQSPYVRKRSHDEDSRFVSGATPIVRKRCHVDHEHDFTTCEFETIGIIAERRESKVTSYDARKRCEEMPTKLDAYANDSKARQNATRRAWIALSEAERTIIAREFGDVLPWVAMGHALPSSGQATVSRDVMADVIGSYGVGSSLGTSQAS